MNGPPAHLLCVGSPFGCSKFEVFCLLMSDSPSSSELRWHPLLRQWVAVAAHRQGRPQLPEDWCPFCPGSGRVPSDYSVYLYSNDFPAFSESNPPFSPQTELFSVAGRRLVASNESFFASLPFFGRFPTELQIYARRHVGSLSDVTSDERNDLALLIKLVRQKYDGLYGFPMPLMMLVRQAPVKGSHPYFHFHVEFLPIQRSPTKLKYLAAVESGNGTFLNDTRPEEQAALMRLLKN